MMLLRDLGLAVVGTGLQLQLVARAAGSLLAGCALLALGTRPATARRPLGAGLGDVGFGDVRHRLPERIGRLGRTEIALVVIVAHAIVADIGVVLSGTWTIGSHRGFLARLAMPGMTPAPLAVLAQGDAIRVVALR